jgi:hypothetical protein
MSTWTTISNAAVAVGAIPSSTTVTALRDNPVAIAAAATSAPVVFAGWHPVDKVSIGDGKTGLIYDHAVNGTVAEVVTPDFADGYEYRILGIGISHDNASTRNFAIQGFRETDAAYTTAYTYAAGANSSALFDFDIEVRLPRISRVTHIWGAMGAVNGTIESAKDGVITSAGANKILRARIVTATAANIDAGKIYMFRRREYASGP